MASSPAFAVFGGVACVLLVALAIAVFSAYNRLMELRNQVDTAWAQTDVQLKRWHDLIPPLIDMVRGYAPHEWSVIDAVVAARGRAMDLTLEGSRAAGPAQRAEAENALGQALGHLVAVAESYPQLRSHRSFSGLLAELAMTADRIASSRQSLNTATETYNRACRRLPTNIFAAIGGFRSREYFAVPTDDRSSVQIRL